jgi:hypothetical protein
MYVPTKSLKQLIRQLILEKIDFKARIAEKNPKKEEKENPLLVAVKKFPKGMLNIGVNVDEYSKWKILGTGTRGTAFDIGENKVLKLTDDENEAKAAVQLLKLSGNVTNIVTFYDVAALGNTGMFAILQEKLTPISNEEKTEINTAFKTITPLRQWLIDSDSWDEVTNNVKKYFRENEKFSDEIKLSWKIIEKFKIKSYFEMLGKLGIKFFDYHGDNFMKRGDELVLIDIGNSKIAGDTAVETFKESSFKRR